MARLQRLLHAVDEHAVHRRPVVHRVAAGDRQAGLTCRPPASRASPPPEDLRGRQGDRHSATSARAPQARAMRPERQVARVGEVVGDVRQHPAVQRQHVRVGGTSRRPRGGRRSALAAPRRPLRQELVRAASASSPPAMIGFRPCCANANTARCRPASARKHHQDTPRAASASASRLPVQLREPRPGRRRHGACTTAWALARAGAAPASRASALSWFFLRSLHPLVRTSSAPAPRTSARVESTAAPAPGERHVHRGRRLRDQRGESSRPAGSARSAPRRGAAGRRARG